MIVNRVVTFLLLPVFAFGILCPYFVFYLQRQLIKEAVKLSMETDSFEGKVTLHFSSDEFRHLEWLEENEFYYQGSRYDLIKKSVDTNGGVNLVCIDDERETHFFENFSKFINDNTLPFSGTTKSKSFNIFFDKYLSENFKSALLITIICFDVENYVSGFRSPLNSFVREVPTPPPDMA